ncbi:MAG: alpha/beta hydrolase family protein, partial [bacterium]
MFRFKRGAPLAVATAAALALAFTISAPPAGAQENVPDFFVDESKLPFGPPTNGVSTTRLFGVHANAGYRIEVPDSWNGKLVLYAHGFRGDGPELTVSNPRIRNFLVSNGFAWAASSYSKNRYDVKAGVKDTMALVQLFNGKVGKPDRVYIHGHSMGGHVTGVAIEQYPKVFDGAMPMCGVMGDVALFDFFLDFNLVAQAVAGFPAQFPPDDNFFFNVITQIVPALGSPYPTVLSEAGETLKAVTRNLSGGPRPTFDLAFFFWNSDLTAPAPGLPFLFGLGNGDGTINGIAPGNVTDNEDRVYQIDTDPALNPDEVVLNDTVLRVSHDAQGRHPEGLANIPPITGKLPVPVVTIHTLGDLFVPFSMEQIYARRAASFGKADRLVSRAIRDVRHCGFAVQEEEQSFADLVDWVENGSKPAGDDILDPDTVAQPDFG